MVKEKQERIRYDTETEKWFKRQLWCEETTVMKCERCGLYYKPELGHKCKAKGEGKLAALN